MKFADQYEAIFGEKFKKEKYKSIPHQFTGRIVGKLYCVKLWSKIRG